MLTFATKKLTIGENGQRDSEDAASLFFPRSLDRAVLVLISSLFSETPTDPEPGDLGGRWGPFAAAERPHPT